MFVYTAITTLIAPGKLCFQVQCPVTSQGSGDITIQLCIITLCVSVSVCVCAQILMQSVL